MTNTIEMTVDEVWDMDEVVDIHIETYKGISLGTKIVKHNSGKLYSVYYRDTHGEGCALGEEADPYGQKDDDMVTLTEVEEREVTTIKYVEV